MFCKVDLIGEKGNETLAIEAVDESEALRVARLQSNVQVRKSTATAVSETEFAALKKGLAAKPEPAAAPKASKKSKAKASKPAK